METGAPWECCLAAEADFSFPFFFFSSQTPMKGYLKISVQIQNQSQFEKFETKLET